MLTNALILAPNLLDRAAEPRGLKRESKLLAADSGVNAALAVGPAPHRAGNHWRWAFAVVLAAIGLTAYLRPWDSLAHRSDAGIDHPLDTRRTVTTDRPTTTGTSTVVLPSTVRPWQTATLHARVSGFLAAWHRDLGAKVKAGELLAEIDTPELDQELAQGVALAHEAVAAAIQARAERVEAEADLRVADAQLVRVRAEVELAKTQFARREKLLDRGAISQEEHDNFLRDLAVRNADVAAAEADLARRRTNLKTRAAIIQAREATARSRQSSVDRLKELQIFKRIVAPFDGVVTHRAAEVGMLVTAGEQSLFVIEDMSRARVQLNVPQTYAVQIRIGAVASVRLPESSLPPIEATITRISESVDATSRTMLAEVELNNTENRFRPGSYAQVTLKTQSTGSWTIPTNTVQMRVDGPHVAVVDDQNEIEIKRVNLGRDMGTRVVAIDGIRGDERLVINPTDDLNRGAQVRVSDAGEPVRKVAQQ